MNEAVDVVFSYCFSDSLYALDVHIFEVKVLGGVVASYEVVDYV